MNDTATNNDSSRKAKIMADWAALEPNQDPLRNMSVVHNGTKGSKFGLCGIRIDGDSQFIDDVLSNLKGLLAGETNCTRLDITRMKVKPRDGYNAGQNAYDDAEVMYIRMSERGTGKRGRPKGSKNKPKTIAEVKESTAVENTAPQTLS